MKIMTVNFLTDLSNEEAEALSGGTGSKSFDPTCKLELPGGIVLYGEKYCALGG